MPQLRAVFLWHMHQPFYKDLVTGEYRLPWVRMHALKDYYGMVKLLDEFPYAHQTFNLVPSLMAQIEDYVQGKAHDPFLAVAAKPAQELTPEERRFALQYLFQANPERMIKRYPRYAELWEQANSPARAAAAEKLFAPQDFTDLQVLSQLAWFDELFLAEPEVAALIAKGRDYSLEDQALVVALETELMGRVLPAYAAAAARGTIEISVSPFYHPILPLLCDSDQGRVSCPGLHLPERFQHPEDARAQLERGIALQEKVFGVRPRGCWPSEGSVSEEVLQLGHALGLKWMASDEGVLGRTLGSYFERDGGGRLQGDGAARLYRVYRYESGEAQMYMLFRDHSLSDTIGFSYSGMGAADAAAHFVQSLKDSARPVLEQGRDATVSIILDGENAWEHYYQSGRDFLRRLYEGLHAAGIEMLSAAEAVERESEPAVLRSLVPGSWINANFNVWIGAPEDNQSWNYLKQARDFFSENEARAEEKQRELAFEELHIAEGSDWNWWYGPEHHSANDAEFDELYRKHLSNIYRALGANPPDQLAQPIIQTPQARVAVLPQTSYIHPVINGDILRYFDWIGAAEVSADSRDSAMHGSVNVLEKLHAGIDEQNVYGRVDLTSVESGEAVTVVVNLESWRPEKSSPAEQLKLETTIADGRLTEWRLVDAANEQNGNEVSALAPAVCFLKVLEFSIPLEKLHAEMGGRLRVRASAWKAGLPIDALPREGWLELLIAEESVLQESA